MVKKSSLKYSLGYNDDFEIFMYKAPSNNWIY